MSSRASLLLETLVAAVPGRKHAPFIRESSCVLSERKPTVALRPLRACKPAEYFLGLIRSPYFSGELVRLPYVYELDS